MEIVIHDIIDDTIEYIANPFSGRAVGDASLIGLDLKDPSLQKDILDPYALDVSGRISLLKKLDDKGLFYARKSVEQIARVLGISRATVYKNLREIRKEDVIIRLSRS